MPPDGISVSSLFRPTRGKLAVTTLFVLVFGLCEAPGLPCGRVRFLSNNLLSPFMSNLYAPIGVSDLASVVLSYLLASTVLAAVDHLGVDLTGLISTVLSPGGTVSAVVHIGVAVVSALVLGFFSLPLAYYSLGPQCHGGPCSPSGPTLNWMYLLVDLLFWYSIWGVGFAMFDRAREVYCR